MADPSPVYMILLAEVLAVALFIQFLPQWTRQDIFFAVTVLADFRGTPQGRAILRGYRTESGVHALIACGLIVGGMAANAFGFAMAGMFWQLAGLMAAFLRARKRVQPHAAAPTTVREADMRPRTARTGVPQFLRLAFPLPLLTMAGVAVYLHRHWERVPDRYATHWNAAGAPNGWADRSVEGVYGGLVIGALFYSVIWLAGYGILRWSRRISASGPAAVQENRFRLTTATALFLTGVFVATITGWTSLLPLRDHPDAPPSMTWVSVSTGAFVVVILTLLIRNRPGRVPAVPGPPIGDRTADRHWKAGLFYFNPADPAVLIEKRFGIGYTLNLGRLWTWVLIGVLLGGPWLTILIFKML